MKYRNTKYQYWKRNINKGTTAIAMMSALFGISAQAKYVPEYPFYPPSYSELKDILNEFPGEISSVRNLQENTGNAVDPLVGLFISDNPTIIEDEPVILLTGVIHGREPLGVRAVLELADTLVSDYYTDASVRDIVDNYQIVIVPTMNIWGYENRFRTNNDINLSNNPQNPGVDLNRNGIFGWDRCDNYPDSDRNNLNGPDCYEEGMGTYHGPYPNSEPETLTMQSVVEWLKPIFGVVFHTGTDVSPNGQVLYPYFTTDRFGNDGIQNNGDEHHLKPMSDYRVSRGLADILRQEVLTSRQQGVFCTDPMVSPDACNVPVTGALASAGGTSANYYALTGMLELGVETHGARYTDGDGNLRNNPWIQNHLYEDQPATNSASNDQYIIAKEYARTYAEGMQGLLNDFRCGGQSSASSFDGPGFTGRIVDEHGNPLAATVKVLELDTTLHGDYMDKARLMPYGEEDFKYRVAQANTGRFYRLLPRFTDTDYWQNEYSIEISMDSRRTQIINLPNPGMGSCLHEFDDIVMLPETTTQSEICTVPPQLIGITNGSVLPEDGTTVEWTSNGCHYWVYAGTAPDQNEYHNQSLAGATSFTLSGYPTDGSDVYLTLLYRNTNIVDAPWERAYFLFKAPSDTLCINSPTLLAPQNGSILGQNSETISWTSNGCHYWVYAGTAPDRNEYHNQSLAGATSFALTGYPTDGSDVYITLLHRNTNIIGAPWKREYFTFEAPTP